MVQRQTVGAARAAVVSGQEKPLEAQLAHDLHLVPRHSALRVRSVVVGMRWLRAVAVASQVGGDDGEIAREAVGDLVPHDVRLWITVHQQQRRSGTTVTEAN